jgi:hypothetical protein
MVSVTQITLHCEGLCDVGHRQLFAAIPEPVAITEGAALASHDQQGHGATRLVRSAAALGDRFGCLS